MEINESAKPQTVAAVPMYASGFHGLAVQPAEAFVVRLKESLCRTRLLGRFERFEYAKCISASSARKTQTLEVAVPGSNAAYSNLFELAQMYL